MAIRSVGSAASANTTGLASKEITRVVSPPDPDVWVRNPSWPPCSVNVGDNKFVGLYAVWPTTGNFVAVNVHAAFTVNWGDGTVTNYTSGSQANYEFSYSAAPLVGTEAPVTLNASTNTVDRTAHGYTNGMTVTLYSVAGTSAVTSGRPYFVINATANTFQVSLTSGGSAIAFGTNGTANLLPYRVATVTITPQAGQSLSVISLDQKYNVVSGIQAYAPMWLDIAVASQNLNSLALGVSSGLLQSGPLERIQVREIGPTMTSLSSLASGCRSLRKAEITANTSAINTFNSAFNNCSALTEVNLFDTSGCTSFSSMFSGCTSLRRVPAFNTTASTSFSNMFNGCSFLTDVPALNGPNVTTATSMFTNCASLVNAPAINFSSLLSSVTSMFSGCRSLKNVPLYNLQGVNNAGSMFANCHSLEEVPAFNFQNANNISSLFNNCYSLKSVQFYTTSALLTATSVFNGCASLQEAPFFNTSAVSVASGLFSSCTSLVRVPEYNFTSAVDISSMFASCSALTEGPRLNLGTSVTNMASMFSSCTALVKAPSYNTPNVANMSSMFVSCNNLLEAPMMDTSKVTNASGMFNGCTSLTYVPLYDLGLVTNVGNMFNSCSSLDHIPEFNFANVTNAASIFSTCRPLTEVPALNFNSVTSSAGVTSIVSSCSSLARFRAYNIRWTFGVNNCKLSKSALEEIFANLPTVSAAQTVNVGSNYGVGLQTSRTTTTTSGSTVITLSDTTGIAVGQLVTSNNLALATAATGTADVSTDTITRTAHGLANGTKVSFSVLGTVTGVSLNTIYYVVNAATDTFQVAATVGGAAIDLTGTGGSVSFRYPAYVVSIVPSTSVTMSAPAVASGAVATTFRDLDLTDAILKNWAVST